MMITLSNNATKHVIINRSTDVLILLGLADLVRRNWDQAMFDDFVEDRSHLLLSTAVCLSFHCIMPLLPEPQKKKEKQFGAKDEEEEEAKAPTVGQAWAMLAFTWTVDYLILGALFLFWNATIPLDDGGGEVDGALLCPFAAATTFHTLNWTLCLKDDLECRWLFRDYIGRAKLNSWHHRWSNSWHYVSRIHAYNTVAILAFSLLGMFDFQNILSSPYVIARIWLEAFVEARLIDMIGMYIFHKWMHTSNAYFLHKKHHLPKRDCTIVDAFSFDLLDLIFEFGGGVPMTCVLKYALGMNPQVHFLSLSMAFYSGINAHAGNPYTAYYFNPIMDYMSRSTICHNLHHAVQLDYYLGAPLMHFFSSAARHKDIIRYNKEMKTSFPPQV